jgi:4-amino-4-deoxy-L-arabinose transferase-like glycosyltransferase
VSAAVSSTGWQQDPTASPSRLPAREQHPRLRFLVHPLTVICTVQVVLSLSLVWSNTAFADEAQYISSGELEWAHWLHGADIPPYLLKSFSGSPVIYPPIGALANDIGGLAGARILSLLFMLGVTILLYLTASRLFDDTTAVIASALWALSEPSIRLAFATFDPLSVLLTALSAWFIVQASYRSRRGAFIAAGAVALALANATAYSGIIIDPIVIIFAFLVWLPCMRWRQASLWLIWFAGILALLFTLLMTVSGSWTGLMSTVINRGSSDHQSILLVLSDSWGYSGLIAVLAVIGAISAFAAEDRQHATLLALLACTALVVPTAQFHEQTAWSLDKHLAYGILFAAIAAGYGCSRLIRKFPRAGRQLAASCCAIAFIYPVATSWAAAWNVYHAWPNARSFIGEFTSKAAQSRGLIYVSETGPENIAEYYTSEGRDTKRWSTGLSLDPATGTSKTWESYYAGQLSTGNYGVIVLFYSTTFSSTPNLPGEILVSPPKRGLDQEILRLEGDNPGEPGLPDLTLALESDTAYGRPTATGPYDGTGDNGIYAIWVKEPQR